jgi:hypothetical protein
LRTRSLWTWSSLTRRLSGELRSWELLSWRLLSWKLLSGELRPGELRPGRLGAGPERSGVWLLCERRATWTSGARLHGSWLSWPHLAVGGEASAVLPGAVWSSTVGRSRLLTARLRTARPATARLHSRVLHSRVLPALVLRSRLLGPVRPGGWCALRAAHGRALHPGAGGRHALTARSVAIGATVARPRPCGGLPGETRSPGESGTSGRDGTAAHAVVTWTPGKPRTPIPRAIVTRQAGLASWTGAPAVPGVGISPAFIIRPVFGVRPPTPAPPPREPCHIIDRRHTGDR